MARSSFWFYTAWVNLGIWLGYSSFLYAENAPRLTIPTELTQTAQKELEHLTQTLTSEKHHKQTYQANANDKTEEWVYSTQCLPYHDIELRGVTLIPTEHLLPQEGSCISEAYLNQLSKNITQAYLKAGYIYNPFQFQTDGTKRLILQVIEGKVSHIHGEDSLINPNMLFPNMVGKALNIKDLDQGLDQTNRLSGSSVTVDVLPQSDGKIELVLHHDTPKRISATLSLDNLGSSSTGTWVTRGLININSPLGLSDTLSLSASHSLRPHGYPYNRSIAFYYSVPYGYYTMNLFGSFSQYRSKLSLIHHTLQQKGRTWQLGSRVERVIKRDSNAVRTAYLQVEHINAKNGLEDIIYSNQSPIISTITLGLNQLFLTQNGLWVIDGNYEYGRLSPKDRQERVYQNYHKFNSSIDFMAYHTWFSQWFRQQHRLTAQYSSTYLPTIKQQDILGYGAVRGFRFMSSTAEKAWVLENNLYLIKNWGQWQIEPYLGLDFGVQRNVAKDQQKSESYKALGGAVGVRVAWQDRYRFNLEWAKGKSLMSNTNASEHMFSLHLSMHF